MQVIPLFVLAFALAIALSLLISWPVMLLLGATSITALHIGFVDTVIIVFVLSVVTGNTSTSTK